MKSRVLFLVSLLCLSHSLFSMDDQSEQNPANLDDEVAHHEEIAIDCAICLGVPGENIDIRPINLPCDHSFHRGCLLPWIEESRIGAQFRCPVCRREVIIGELGLSGEELMRINAFIPQRAEAFVVGSPLERGLASVYMRFYNGMAWMRNVQNRVHQHVDERVPEWMQLVGGVAVRTGVLYVLNRLVSRFAPSSVEWTPGLAVLTSSVLGAGGTSLNSSLEFQLAMIDTTMVVPIRTVFRYAGCAGLGWGIGAGMRLITEQSTPAERFARWSVALGPFGERAFFATGAPSSENSEQL